MNNTKGWTSVLEVFFSILLLASVLTLVLNKQTITKHDKSEEIYEKQAIALEIIQRDLILRSAVINSPIGEASLNIKDSIKSNMPDYLECIPYICDVANSCILNNPPEKKEIFVQSVLITTDTQIYNPHKLSLFCWEK